MRYASILNMAFVNIKILVKENPLVNAAMTCQTASKSKAATKDTPNHAKELLQEAVDS